MGVNVKEVIKKAKAYFLSNSFQECLNELKVCKIVSLVSDRKCSFINIFFPRSQSLPKAVIRTLTVSFLHPLAMITLEMKTRLLIRYMKFL